MQSIATVLNNVLDVCRFTFIDKAGIRGRETCGRRSGGLLRPSLVSRSKATGKGFRVEETFVFECENHQT